MATARRGPAPHRLWGGAVTAVALGSAVYLAMAYRVLQAGGFTTTSIRSVCAEAATGRASALYRMAENVEVARTFFPLSATCRWSGGSWAELVGAGWWSWAGPTLVASGVVILIGLQLSSRRRHR